MEMGPGAWRQTGVARRPWWWWQPGAAPPGVQWLPAAAGPLLLPPLPLLPAAYRSRSRSPQPGTPHVARGTHSHAVLHITRSDHRACSVQRLPQPLLLPLVSGSQLLLLLLLLLLL
jgi:hypothetical protein